MCVCVCVCERERERERVKIQVTVQAPHANIGCMMLVLQWQYLFFPIGSYSQDTRGICSTINEKAEI